MTKISIIFALLVLLITVGCDVYPISEPVSEPELIGIYVPNRDGKEALVIRENHSWARFYWEGGSSEREYIASENRVYIDSGSWEFIVRGESEYEIVLTSTHDIKKSRISDSILTHESSLNRDSIKVYGVMIAPIIKIKSIIQIYTPNLYPDRFYGKLPIGSEGG